VLTFEWDRGKASDNLKKHGVSFSEAITVFHDPLGQLIDDIQHSVDEQRYLLLGFSLRQRLLAVMFTERGERIRLISARAATPSERFAYEENPR